MILLCCIIHTNNVQRGNWKTQSASPTKAAAHLLIARRRRRCGHAFEDPGGPVAPSSYSSGLPAGLAAGGGRLFFSRRSRIFGVVESIPGKQQKHRKGCKQQQAASQLL